MPSAPQQRRKALSGLFDAHARQIGGRRGLVLFDLATQRLRDFLEKRTAKLEAPKAATSGD